MQLISRQVLYKLETSVSLLANTRPAEYVRACVTWISQDRYGLTVIKLYPKQLTMTRPAKHALRKQ
jgi:hypothetical protein